MAPLVVAAAVDDGDGGLVPLVRPIDRIGVGGAGIAVEGGDEAVRMLGAGLAPDRGSARQALRPGVAEAAHPVQGPEIVIEGAVLLHEDDHMLDIHDRARGVVGGNGHRLAHRRRQQVQRRSSRHAAQSAPQERPPII